MYNVVKCLQLIKHKNTSRILHTGGLGGIGVHTLTTSLMETRKDTFQTTIYTAVFDIVFNITPSAHYNVYTQVQHVLLTTMFTHKYNMSCSQSCLHTGTTCPAHNHVYTQVQPVL